MNAGEALELAGVVKRTGSDPMTGEVLDDKAADAGVRRAVDAVRRSRVELRGIADGCRAEVKRLQERVATVEALITGLDERVGDAMRLLSIDAVKTDLGSVRLMPGKERVVITDADQLPERYIKPGQPDKAKIREAMKGGGMPGAKLEVGPKFMVWR